MNPHVHQHQELRNGNYSLELTRKRSSIDGSLDMAEQRTFSESRIRTTEDQTSNRSSVSISEHGRTSIQESSSSMLMHERNTSSVALLPPVLTRDLLATSAVRPPRSRSVEGGDDVRPPRSRSAEGGDDARPDPVNPSGSTFISCSLYDDRIAKAETLDLLAEEYPLPKIQGPRWYNRLRYHYLSVCMHFPMCE